MYTLLLSLIYLAFISLGLPDALLGAAWPVIQQDFALPLSYAGILTVIIAAGTVISSLNSDFLTKKFGTGRVTACSVGVTAVALFGFSVAPNFGMLCLVAIPYGLGAGAVDASLNNFVALHYATRHMSWLHCFWGVGASLGPYIMALSLTGASGWTGGYQTIAIIQIFLTAVLLLSLPLWKKVSTAQQKEISSAPLKLSEIVKIPGVPLILLTFFCYCGIETTAGTWATSYLYLHHGVSQEVAASYAAYFYLGITLGRFLCGFIAEKFGDKQLIRGGAIIMLLGTLGLIFAEIATSALIVIGLGCAPIYPAIIHATPDNFGADKSQAIIGIEMASAYVGTICAPALFGLIADWVSISLYPAYLLLLAAGILGFSGWFYAKKIS